MFKTYCFSDSQIQRTSAWLPVGRGKGVVQELVSSRDKLLEARWVQGSAVQYEEHSQCFILTVNGKWSLKIVLKVKKKKPTTYKLHDFLSGLVIQYLFGLKEKLSFQSFWLLSLKKADLLGAVFLALGRIWWLLGG